MQQRIVRVREGVAKSTASGVFRRLLLLPENVGIQKFEMGVLMLNPGQSWGYPDHHHGDEEAYFVLQGEGLQTIDQEKYEIEKYMAIYLPPDCIHITENTGNEPLWVLYVRTPEEYRHAADERPGLQAAPLPIAESRSYPGSPRAPSMRKET